MNIVSLIYTGLIVSWDYFFFRLSSPDSVCLVFLLGFSPAMLCSVSYGVQQATIWTVNVVSVTTKLFYTLLALCFLNHDHHYHYRWCSILFWSLDSGLCMIKNKIYGTVQSAASVVLAEPAVLPALLLLSSNPTNVYFRHYASTARSLVTWHFYHPVGETMYEYFIFVKSTVLIEPWDLRRESYGVQQQRQCPKLHPYQSHLRGSEDGLMSRGEISPAIAPGAAVHPAGCPGTTLQLCVTCVSFLFFSTLTLHLFPPTASKSSQFIWRVGGQHREASSAIKPCNN